MVAVGARREPLELVEGLVEAAADGVLVAHEAGEELAAGIGVIGKAEHEGSLVVAGLGGGAAGDGRIVEPLLAADDLVALHQHAGLHPNHAAEAPLGGGELVHERFLELVGGREAGEEAGEEGIVLGGVFGGADGIAGAESVGAAVPAGDGLALWGFGAGGAAGVAAVGVDLLLAGHGTTSEPALARKRRDGRKVRSEMGEEAGDRKGRGR